ncbi:MAG TPA: Synerg-CTERM sorting domain-containing protein [Kofleriaceae bacterium]|nr:Synerg-CTERM sorting domain-containing protein [Kofleriaceae bacterium]
MKIIIVLLLLAAPLVAHAQTFPADTAYRPLRCGNAVMTDGFGDDNANRDERDVVGDVAAPAGLRASDGTYLYLRMRLEDDPAPGGAVRTSSWGMEFDLDNDLTDYEVLVLVEGLSGAAGNVQVFANTQTTMPNSPADPADTPPAQTYMFASNARTVAAAGSNFGGNADFFLDFAVPWSALTPLGLDRDTPVRVWVASSTLPDALNGDFACHAGGGGTPPLDGGTASDPTTGDPNDPGANAGTGKLEGGGGCSAGAGAGWLVLLAVPLVWRKRRSV